MTKKLYYINSYISSFKASVLSASATEGGYEVILDQTAFFPEEGGQSSDSGYIGEAKVIHVYERSGIVYHITDTAPALGENDCRIDFAPRFEKMQCHTAEHILCGLIHKHFGLDNVGFHLGEDEVTFDVNGVLDRARLDMIEREANDIVFSCLSVKAYFPTAEELSGISYRAKLDLTDGVRLVEVEGVDICACCAPHVSSTGEIGMIKILDFMKHRGGTRIWMVAGNRALADYRARYDSVKRISGMLSTPQTQVATTLEAYIAETEAMKAALKDARLRIAEQSAGSVAEQSGSAVFYFPDFSIAELIVFSNIANKKIGGITVALSGSEGDYKYVISSHSVDLRAMSRDINSALCGRGGGRPEMIQGSFGVTLEEIKEYFAK
jgi:alanyl-tRNA synthetase